MSGVRVFEQTAAPDLRRFVRRFLVVHFPERHEDRHLPDTSPVAAFTLRGACRLDGDGWAPQAAFTGLRDPLRTHAHRHCHAVLLARFTPAGAAALLRAPMDAFSAATVDLGDVLPLDSIADQLDAARTDGERVSRLEALLRARLAGAEPDPLAAEAARQLERSGGNVRIGPLASQLGVSQSALERRFQRHVGLTPKAFAGIVRLGRAVRVHRDGDDLTTAAHAAGYFDQSHFIHDFRRAAGSTPSAFFA